VSTVQKPSHRTVIPAKAGIQEYHVATKPLDPGSSGRRPLTEASSFCRRNRSSALR